MDYQTFFSLVQNAAKRVEKGDLDRALQEFENLLNENISDLDKANTCVNIAVIWEQKGESREVLRWYDKGIRYEKSLQRFLAQESKAAYYWRLGRHEEAVRIYRDLVKKPFMTEEDKYRISQFLTQLP